MSHWRVHGSRGCIGIITWFISERGNMLMCTVSLKASATFIHSVTASEIDPASYIDNNT